MKVALILRYLLVPVVGLILLVCFTVAAGWLTSKVLPSDIGEEWRTVVIVAECLIGMFFSAWASWGLLIGFGPSKNKIEEYSRRFAERLRQPDLPAVERQLGRPLPTCVQALYVNREELMRGDFEVASAADAAPEVRWYVAFYQPADGQSAKDTGPGLEKYFAFADDGCGNGYLIDPKEEDPAVLFHDHETGELERVCDRFTEFMRWPRFDVKELDH